MKRMMRTLWLAALLLALHLPCAAETPAKSVLFIGDSMTGWLAERLNAYGQENGFTVMTEIWDGSTIKKWAQSPRLGALVKQYKPDVIFVSLGLNELLEPNPQKRLKAHLDKIKATAGGVPIIWLGPPSWPGKKGGEVLNSWLASQLGAGHYFNSLSLDIARQSARNPHPTRKGSAVWIDRVMEWMPQHGAVQLPGYKVPKAQMVRPKVFNYRRMSAK